MDAKKERTHDSGGSASYGRRRYIEPQNCGDSTLPFVGQASHPIGTASRPPVLLPRLRNFEILHHGTKEARWQERAG